MDIYKSLSLKVADDKREPAVWVRRLVIYEAISPEPVVIRDIPLTKGLNIVWAEEPDSDDAAADITGHSAGKTSFCRLLRYVLGEKTFGTDANMALIQKVFPGGYVGAEFFVGKQQWSVIRPIGNGRSSYVKTDGSIEDALRDKSNATYQDEYPQKIGLEALLHDLDTAAIVPTNDPIKWGHLLAWCSRDQEARFQNIHDWRSPRSESDWPNFRFPKTDPLFVMRTVLGLFLPDELKGEEELANLQRTQESLAKKLDDLKREPQFRINLYDAKLRRQLQIALPMEQDIESRPFRWEMLQDDLERLTEKAVNEIKGEILIIEAEQQTLQTQIDDLGAKIRQIELVLKNTAAAFGLETAATRELVEGQSKEQEFLKQLRDVELQQCPLGGVIFKECMHIQERRDSLQIKTYQDAAAAAQAEAKRRETLKSIESQQKTRTDQVTQLRKDRNALQIKRDALSAGIRKKQDQAGEVKGSCDELARWVAASTKPGEFKDLDDCQTNLRKTIERIEKLEGELKAMLTQHEENRELLASIFSGAVRGVLSSGTYDGKVSLAERELNFRITHGTAMSGEAVETLSVLLADVACLIYNSASSRAKLPGFLLHDSPREADLGIRIYRGFIRLVAALQTHFGSPDKCPFQYIITTTTSPPEELRDDKAVRLRLNAAIANELLFRRSIASVPTNDPNLLAGEARK